MNKSDIKKFFETCLSKSLLYMGKNAICLFSEPDNCYFITQVEDDDYESIYEDQVKNVLKKNENEYMIIDDIGDTSVISFL